jgi:hypothetical protein
MKPNTCCLPLTAKFLDRLCLKRVDVHDPELNASGRASDNRMTASKLVVKTSQIRSDVPAAIFLANLVNQNRFPVYQCHAETSKSPSGSSESVPLTISHLASGVQTTCRFFQARATPMLFTLPIFRSAPRSDSPKGCQRRFRSA